MRKKKDKVEVKEWVPDYFHYDKNNEMKKKVFTGDTKTQYEAIKILIDKLAQDFPNVRIIAYTIEYEDEK